MSSKWTLGITHMSKKPTSKKPVQGAKSSGSTPHLGELEQLLELMGRHQVAELEWESAAGTKLCLRTQASVMSRGTPIMMAAPQQMMSGPAQNAAHAVASAPTVAPGPAALSANQKQVLSPFVGTFYRSSSPGGAPYVKEGSVVKPGDSLCIVEAMKLMNEIESDYSGKIVSVLVENGQPVEFGEPLFLIEV